MQDKLTKQPNASDGKQKHASILDASDTFVHRHIGPRASDIDAMLATLGYDSLDALIDDTIPRSIRMQQPLDLGPPRGEHQATQDLRALSRQNDVYRSCIGMGYANTITPAVIQRNVLENPGWYTQYTPYQAEIAQGRLEALLNFQTMVADLTGLPIANASLLDESTAAAEAMVMCHAVAGEKNAFFIASDCHPQTIALVRARAEALQIQVVVGAVADLHLAAGNVCGALLQYPNTHGEVVDHRQVIDGLHTAGALAVVATDLLALTLLTPPGEFGADIAVGSTQRFGVPMGFGGPHAGFLATHDKHLRKMPGRIVGVSKDAHGHNAYRLTLQTREQHIRRDKATSNICTAQALPAILASMYAVYHGPDGLRRIARRVFAYTRALATGLRKLGYDPGDAPFFDTLSVHVRAADAKKIVAEAEKRRVNLRAFDDETIGIALDEATTRECVWEVLEAFAVVAGKSLESVLGGASSAALDALLQGDNLAVPAPFARSSAFLTHPVFNTHHSETEMMRYMAKLQERDLALNRSMIPLGSCTMKLNGTTEMMPITWPEFAHVHPFAPRQQTAGYDQLFRELESQLAEITGFAGVSLQPNSGAQGEYAGLLVIRAYHKSTGHAERDVCLIPATAHGTNPASAVSAGFRVVAVASDAAGNIDLADLRKKATEHRDRLGAFMITYPSTAGVFEENVREFCKVVHENGGLVYMDGANMNAQVGLCRPGDIGADVCHLNLHKTFCIPHGGGGPGMGPIGVTKALLPFLPGHPVMRPHNAGDHAVGPVAAAPYGSPMILPISYMYIVLMGGTGLTRASQVAILNANYMAKRLSGHFNILYSGRNGRVAHEFIIDLRPFAKTAGVQIDDVAKRLMDYGFHAPTMSWPVPGTLMVEPTESEPKPELDRFCDAMIAIREEIRAIENGTIDREDNPLKNAPHTASEIAGDAWNHPYSREVAAFPAPWLRESKFWPPVGRIDNYYGDRNVFCTCPPVEAYGS